MLITVVVQLLNEPRGVVKFELKGTLPIQDEQITIPDLAEVSPFQNKDISEKMFGNTYKVARRVPLVEGNCPKGVTKYKYFVNSLD